MHVPVAARRIVAMYLLRATFFSGGGSQQQGALSLAGVCWRILDSLRLITCNRGNEFVRVISSSARFNPFTITILEWA